MNNQNLNNIAWGNLFKEYDILHHIDNDGCFIVSANQIKKYREPRLMAKFDHAINLPELFSSNQLSILPIARGGYIIARFNAYHKFELSNSKIYRASLPPFIHSLDANCISSEAIALNCAYASGIIADFMADSEIIATVSGRMGSGEFSFTINDMERNSHLVNVRNAQIEIDAGYEGVSSLALFEAKMDLSEDFIIRQLYYPYRVWQNRISKPVRPIFIIYSNGIYRLAEYRFEDPNNYNSLVLVQQKNYSVEDTMISITDIQEVLENTILVSEPAISFPQADSFERVINLCEILNMKEMSRNDVTEQYDFDTRQTNYYTDAARYLGLLTKKTEYNTVVYSITKKGKRILSLGYKQRQLEFCRCILSHKVFNELFRIYLRRGIMPSTNETVNVMKVSGIYNVKSDSTYMRRASTIKSWISWIISLIDE